MPYCINCRSEMLQKRTKFGIIYTCSNCDSKMATVYVLKKRHIKSEIYKEVWWKAKREITPFGRKCPSCSSKMSVQNFRYNNKNTEIDICRHCSNFWFDKGEFEEVPFDIADEPVKIEKTPEILLAEAKLESDFYRIRQENDFDDSSTPEGLKGIAAFYGLPIEEDDPFIKFYAYITWILSCALVAVFLISTQDLQGFADMLGYIPAHWYKDFGTTIFTSFFVHGSIAHLIGNTYFLMAFGDNVEEDTGRIPFVVLLTISHLAGLFLHTLFDPHKNIPLIGASAGISGVVAYYAIAFPKKKIGFLLRFYFRFQYIRLPAWAFLFFWIVMQLMLMYIQVAGYSDVSALGHIGGIAIGIFFAVYVRFRRDDKEYDKKMREKIKQVRRN